MVDKTVALAMDVYFSAPKKQAKCRPSKMPAIITRPRLVDDKPVGRPGMVIAHRIALAIAMRQKAIVIAGRSGTIRTKMLAVLTANKPRGKTIITGSRINNYLKLLMNRTVAWFYSRCLVLFLV